MRASAVLDTHPPDTNTPNTELHCVAATHARIHTRTRTVRRADGCIGTRARVWFRKRSMLDSWIAFNLVSIYYNNNRRGDGGATELLMSGAVTSRRFGAPGARTCQRNSRDDNRELLSPLVLADGAAPPTLKL